MATGPNSCDPCCNIPANVNDAYFKQAVLVKLCDLAEGEGDFETLCDPNTGQVVFVRFTFDSSGAITGSVAILPDGTPYPGVVADLVACEQASLIDSAVYAEDSPHISGSNGVFTLSVRSDVAASTADTTGDYAAFITDANGKLWTNAEVTNGAGAAAVNIQDGGNSITVDGSVAVTNGAGAAAVNIQDGGNSITVDGSVTATVAGQYAEDTLHVSGDIGLFALSVRSDAAASTAGADGEYAGFITDANGKLWTNAEVTNGAGAAAVNIQDGGNSITVDGSVAVTNGAGAAAVNIQDGGNSITVDGTVTVGSQTLVEAGYATSTTAFGAIGAAFAAGLVDANPKKIVDLYNGTDTEIEVSFDGVTAHVTLIAGKVLLYDLAAAGLMESSSITIRHTGVAPTAGTFYINVAY